MKTIFNIKCLLFIPIIFLFLPAFAIWIPGLYKGFLVNNILFIIYAILIVVFDYKTLLTKLVKLYKYTPFKYFVWVVLLMILNGFLVSIFNLKLLLNVISSTFMYIILWMLPIFIYFFYIIETHISFKKFISIFILLFWINLIIGLISWVGELFNIQFVTDLFNFLANIRILYDTNSMYDLGMQSSNYLAFGLPRLDNLFEEPAFYAEFLFLFLPLIYSVGLSKVKILGNNILNIIIKRTIIPITLLSIFLTFSPIFLVFTAISTIFYFRKYLTVFFKKYWILVLFIILVFVTWCGDIDWEETYISRILNVLSEVKSFNDLILIEPSLATRLVSFYNQVLVFCKNVLFGVGYSNLGFVMKEQLVHSPVILTPELNIKLQMAISTGYKMPYNKAFVYEFLAENGIILFSLFCYFYYRLLYNVKHILGKCNECKNDFCYVIANGINGVLWNLLFIMFYAVYFTKCNALYICLILSIMFIFSYKQERRFC